MASDRTEHQSTEEQRKAKELSLKPTRPPSQVPGYTVQSFIGSGAYGEVWSGIDRNTGRSVAVKYYTRRSSLDVTMLSREVEKLVVLAANRYVVQLLDVGWDADPPYYVMDYIENGSLEDRLNEKKTFSVAEATELFKEVAQGLMHLHGKGILHCDLKPGNVLLDHDHKPRLADFGQSRLSHELTPALGTLFFMAPEQADLEAMPDARWDVYALGALLYSMLTGEPPYRDAELVTKLEATNEIEKRLRRYRHTLQKSPKPTAHRRVPGVDRMLADIIDRCIAADPKARYTSVQSVLLALQQREQVHATRPLKILGLLGPLLLLGIMSVFGWNAYNRSWSRSEEGITTKAIESNNWAAQLAARSAEEQIDEYFRAVKDLATDEKFIKIFEESLSDEVRDFSRKFADPNSNADTSLDAEREEFEKVIVRQSLEDLLRIKLNDPDAPSAASWFVCDRWGTQIASVFDTKSAKKTLGKNYSYRSYFNDTDQDFFRFDENKKKIFEVNEDLDMRVHILESHLSGVFQSDATATWKIAFSMPLLINERFEGILAVTVEMGYFIEFENVESQYAMMIDGRSGENSGIVLEHPLLDRVRKTVDDQGRLRDLRRLSARVVDVEKLGKNNSNFTDPNGENYRGQWLGGIADFVDPMGEDLLGENYRGKWVAGIATVKRTVGTNADQEPNRRETGLIVIAVEDYNSVIEPVQKLGRQLVQLAIWALIVVLAVAALLLYFLLRALGQSRKRLSRSFVSQTESTGLNSAETVTNPTLSHTD